MSSNQQNITAIIYDKRGRVLSIGKNSYVKTHPWQAELARRMGDEHKHYLHAEIHAIVLCRQIERAHKMVVFRYMVDGTPALAKPCKICQEALRETPIKEVSWTT